MVSKYVTHKKTRMMNCTCCLGFRACNTPKRSVVVVLVLQVAQKKNQMTSMTFVVVVSELTTHKKTNTFIILVLKLATHKQNRDDERSSSS
jgi:hypothetical protein